jgi:hypothetical protein
LPAPSQATDRRRRRAIKLILAFNQSAAKGLGLTPSLPLLASVDELVE